LVWVCNFGAFCAGGQGSDGGERHDHCAGVNARIGRLDVGKGGIDERFPNRNPGVLVGLPMGIDVCGHAHLDLSVVGRLGEIRRLGKHARPESPDISESIVLDDAVRQKTDLINGVQNIPRASMHTIFLLRESRDILDGAVVARESCGKTAVGIRQVPFSPGGIIQVHVPRSAVVDVVGGGSEVESDRTTRYDLDVLGDGHRQIEVDGRLREAGAGDENESEKCEENLLHCCTSLVLGVLLYAFEVSALPVYLAVKQTANITQT